LNVQRREKTTALKTKFFSEAAGGCEDDLIFQLTGDT